MTASNCHTNSQHYSKATVKQGYSAGVLLLAQISNAGRYLDLSDQTKPIICPSGVAADTPAPVCVVGSSYLCVVVVAPTEL